MTTAVELLQQVRVAGYELGKPVYSRIAELIRQGNEAFVEFKSPVSTIDDAVALFTSYPDLPQKQAVDFLRITYDTLVGFLDIAYDFASLYESGWEYIGKIISSSQVNHQRRYRDLSNVGERARELAVRKIQIVAEKELLALYLKATLSEKGMKDVIEHLGI